MPCPHHIHYNLYQYLSELNVPFFSLSTFLLLHPLPTRSPPLKDEDRLPHPHLHLHLLLLLHHFVKPLSPLDSSAHTSKSFTPFIVQRSSGLSCQTELMEFGGRREPCQPVTLGAQWSPPPPPPPPQKKKKKPGPSLTGCSRLTTFFTFCHYQTCKCERIIRDLPLSFYYYYFFYHG